MKCFLMFLSRCGYVNVCTSNYYIVCFICPGMFIWFLLFPLECMHFDFWSLCKICTWFQAKSLIAKLTEEKNAAIHQNNKLRQELVSALLSLFTDIFSWPSIFWNLDTCQCFVYKTLSHFVRFRLQSLTKISGTYYLVWLMCCQALRRLAIRG